MSGPAEVVVGSTLRGERRRTAALALPYGLGLVILVAVPAIWMIAMSFTDYDLLRAAKWVGFGNFRELASDDRFGRAVRNSLQYVVLSAPLRLVLVVALGLFLHRRSRGNGVGRIATVLPSVVPDAAYALVWLWILNPMYGPLNIILCSFGGPRPSWLSEPTAARVGIVLLGLFQIGESLLVLLATRQAIPPSLYELAALEGASPAQQLRRITLPILAPTLALLVARDVVFAFQATFVPALLVTNGGPPPDATTYVPLFVYRNAFEYLRYGYAAAASLVMLAATAAVVAAQWRIVRRHRRAMLL